MAAFLLILIIIGGGGFFIGYKVGRNKSIEDYKLLKELEELKKSKSNV